MSKPTTTRSSRWIIRFAYGLVNLSFYLCWLAAGFVLLAVLAYALGFSFANLTVQTPIAVELAPEFSSSDSEIEARPYIRSFEGMASIRVGEGQRFLNLFRFSLAFALLMAFAWANLQLKRLLRSVREGQPFDDANPGRIRRLSYVVMAWEPAMAAGHRLAGYALQGLELSGFTIEAADPQAGPLVVTGLVIFVLAEVFETGLRLKRENDLTI